jgi:hypothetical protein
MSFAFEGEDEAEPRQRSVGRLLLAFVGGAALGTGAVLMFSPSPPPPENDRRMGGPLAPLER